MKKRFLLTVLLSVLPACLFADAGRMQIMEQDYQAMNEGFGIDMSWFAAPLCAVLALVIGVLFRSKLCKNPSDMKKYICPSALLYLKKINIFAGSVSLVIFLILFGLAMAGLQGPFVPFVFLLGCAVAGLCENMNVRMMSAYKTAAASDASKDICAVFKNALKVSFAFGFVTIGIAFLGFCGIYFLLDQVIFSPELMENGIKAGFLYLIPKGYLFGANGNLKILDYGIIILAYGFGISIWAMFFRLSKSVFSKAVFLSTEAAGRGIGSSHNDLDNPAYAAMNLANQFGNSGNVTNYFALLSAAFAAAFVVSAALPLAEVATLATKVHAVMYLAAAGFVSGQIGLIAAYVKGARSRKGAIGSVYFAAAAACVVNIALCYGISLLRIGGKNVASVFSPSILQSVFLGSVMQIVVAVVSTFSLSSRKSAAQQSRKSGYRDSVCPVASLIELAVVILAILGVFMLNDGFGQIVQPDIRSSVLESGVSKSLLTSSSSQEASGSWCFGIYGVAMALISMLSSVGFVFIVCAVPVNGNADLSCVQISSAEEKDNFIGIGTGINVINRGLVIVVSATAGFVLLFAEIYSFVFWGLKLGMFKGEMLSQIQNMQSDNLRILASNYGLRLTNISLLGGILIGIAVVVVVYAASVKAVRKTAVKTMDEIGRQAVKSPDADVEKLIADYTVCAAVPMDYSIRFSLIPCLVAVIIPVLAGILFGIPCVIGVFLGSLLTGFVITAVFSRGVEQALDLFIRIMFFVLILFTPVFMKLC